MNSTDDKQLSFVEVLLILIIVALVIGIGVVMFREKTDLPDSAKPDVGKVMIEFNGEEDGSLEVR